MTGRFPTLSACLRHYAQSRPDAIAAAHGAEVQSYAELDACVDRCAALLLAHGVGAGDRVAFLGAPRIAFWTTLLASHRIGAIWLGLNPRHRWPELHRILADAEPSLLFCESSMEASAFDEDRLRDSGLEAVRVVRVATDGRTPEPWRELPVAPGCLSAVRAAESCVDPGQPAVLVYTSGSTGTPKGALLSHASLSWGAEIQTRQLAVEDPRIVCNLPINHVGSIADVCATTLSMGGFIRFQERFDPAAWLAAIPHDRLTIWAGVPTMFIHALASQQPDPRDFATLELILWGGAAMPRDALMSLRRFAPRLKTAYGLTETACHVAFTREQASDDSLSGTIGCPVPEIPIRVMSDGRVCDVDEPGEIQVGGALNLLGYWRNAPASAAAFTADRWLKTGDIGAWTAAGELRLIGRLHDRFKSGGYNIDPREIETVLEAHDAVALAAVVAVPDAQYQEVGWAYIELKPGKRTEPADVDAFLRSRLANYKIPKRLQFVEQLPLLPIGKVDKPAVRAMASSVHEHSSHQHSPETQP